MNTIRATAIVFYYLAIGIVFVRGNSINYSQESSILNTSTVPQKAPRNLVNYRGRGQVYSGDSTMELYHSIRTDSSGIGSRFNNLKQLGASFSLKGCRWMVAECSCGKIIAVKMAQVRKGQIGCMDCKIVRQTKHGQTGSREFWTWESMIARCTRLTHRHFKDYGGRGISVCDHWLHSFENFYADMGPRPSDQHSIDRIDNDGNYEPANCRWATSTEQAANRRNTRHFVFDGQEMTQVELCALFGISKATFYTRLRRGLSVDEAVTRPVRSYSA